MKRFLLALVLMPMMALATPTVSEVTARQRYPWNGLVDIAVTIRGSLEDVESSECAFVAKNSVTKDAITVEHITRNGEDSGSGTTWMRKYTWDAAADVGAVKIDDIALSVDTFVGVQLWEDGPYWATCNVGATKPEEYGYYFWWGDTVGYKRNTNDNGWISVNNLTGFSFEWGNCPTSDMNNSELQSGGYIDLTGNLVAAHDAAAAHLGALWRMPTDAEFLALISNCTTAWTNNWNGTGVNGQLVTGKGVYASRSIFLPATGFGSGSVFYSLGSDGYYWSSTPISDDFSYARYLHIKSNFFNRSYDVRRYEGRSVRPVRGFAK